MLTGHLGTRRLRGVSTPRGKPRRDLPGTAVTATLPEASPAADSPPEGKPQEGPPPQTLRFLDGWTEPLLAFFLYLALACWCLWPLFPLAADHLLGAEQSDALRNAWGFWWVKTMLTDGYLPRYTTWLNYPQGMTILVIDPLNCLASIPFQVIFGIPAGYNYFMVTTLAFGAWGAFMLARDLFKSTPAALMAGAIFGLCPYVYSNAVAGTSEVVNVGWIPLYLRALFQMMAATPDTPWKNLRAPWLRAGVLLVCVTLSSWYYGFIVGLTTLVILSSWALVSLLKRRNLWPTLRQLLLHGTIFVAFTVIMVALYRDIVPSVQRGTIPRAKQLEVLAGNAINLWEVWAPSPERWHRPSLYHMPRELLPAIPLMFLIGLPTSGYWMPVFVVFSLLSISLRPQTAPFELPGWLLESIYSVGDIASWFYVAFLDYFPMSDLIRFPYRYLVIANLAMAMILAAGLARMFNFGNLTRRVGAVVGVLATILVAGRMVQVGNYHETPQTTDVTPPQYVRELQADPEEVGLAQLPLNLSGGQQAFYQVYHHKRLFTFIDFVTSKLHYLPGNMLPISYVTTLFAIHQRGWDERVKGFPSQPPEWPGPGRVLEDMKMLLRVKTRYVAIEEARFKPEDLTTIRELLDPVLTLVVYDEVARVRLYRIPETLATP